MAAREPCSECSGLVSSIFSFLSSAHRLVGADGPLAVASSFALGPAQYQPRPKIRVPDAARSVAKGMGCASRHHHRPLPPVPPQEGQRPHEETPQLLGKVCIAYTHPSLCATHPRHAAVRPDIARSGADFPFVSSSRAPLPLPSPPPAGTNMPGASASAAALFLPPYFQPARSLHPNDPSWAFL